MSLSLDPNYVWRDFVTDGIPSSGKHDPKKPDIRRLLSEHMQALIALIAEQEGLELPNLLIRYTITGGDENDIEATANLPVPEGPGLALFSILIEEENTGPVTINGRPLLTSIGAELPEGAIFPGILLFLDNGDDFRLLSDASMQAINEALRDQAQAARDAAVDARDGAVDARDATVDARDGAVDAASSAGDVDAAFDTYAEAAASLGDLSDGDKVVIWEDEENEGATTRYVVHDGDLVFKVRYADMFTPVYDPQGKAVDAYNSASHDFDAVSAEVFFGSDNVRDAIAETVRPKRLKWVLMSDMQPETQEDIAVWRSYLALMKEQHADADYVIVCGDLVHRGAPYAPTDPGYANDPAPEDLYGYRDLLDDMRGWPRDPRNLLCLPGNHDRDYASSTAAQFGRSYNNYLKFFQKQTYHVRIGNMTLLFMGHHNYQTNQWMPGYQHVWMENLVRGSQDGPVFCFTHGPIRDTPFEHSMPGGTEAAGSIIDSDRIQAFLQTDDGRVEVWASGHIGFGQLTAPEYGWATAWGAFHICNNSNLGRPPDVPGERIGSYCTLEFEDGSDEVTIRRFDARDGSEAFSTTIPMRCPIDLSRGMTFDGRHETDGRYDLDYASPGAAGNRQQFSIFEQAEDIGTWSPRAGIHWHDRVTLTNEQPGVMPAGIGVGTLYSVPGSMTNNEDTLRAAYGAGGGISVEKLSSGQTNYTGITTVWSSGLGRDTDSLLPSFRASPNEWTLFGRPAGLGSHRILHGTSSGLILYNDPELIPETAARIRIAELTPGTGGIALRGTSTAARDHLIFEDPDGVAGTVTVSGGDVTYGGTSDYRLKTDLEPMTGALDRIGAIPVYRGRWKKHRDGDLVDFLLAHEVQEVVPNAVVGEKDGMQTRRHSAKGRAVRCAHLIRYDYDGGELSTGSSEKCVREVRVPECVVAEAIDREDFDTLYGEEGFRFEETEPARDEECVKPQQLDASKLIPLLVAAVKELRAEMAQLRSELTAS